jgi:hypothetical protein
MKNNDDIPTTDTNEIKQLINRVKRGELDQGDELLIEKLLNILLMIVSLLQRKHTSIRRMKEFLLGMKEKKPASAQFAPPVAGSSGTPSSRANIRARMSNSSALCV